MYLSHLLIDTGDNPDRPRPGRLWLRNIYHVHQRLCMAFPSPQQVRDDPQFLLPHNPAQFEQSRFLFRIDNHMSDSQRAIVLVQSQQEPNWDYAFQNARMLIAAPPETKQYSPEFQIGQSLRFRIRINLSKKSKKSADGTDLTTERPGVDSKGRQRSQSKRVSLTWDKDQDPNQVIHEWFSQKASKLGFDVPQAAVVHMGQVTGWKPKRGDADESARHQMKFRSALIEGILTVTDASLFSEAIASGIGAAKAFGFGLLSVASIKGEHIHAAQRPASTATSP